jgi:hypothetical protein
MGIKLGKAICDGPYRAEEWPAPAAGGVYAIMVRDPRWEPLPYRVIYVGQAESFGERFLRLHQRYWDWCAVAGNPSRLYVASYAASTREFRDWLEDRLLAQYRPECNALVEPARSLAA